MRQARIAPCVRRLGSRLPSCSGPASYRGQTHAQLRSDGTHRCSAIRRSHSVQIIISTHIKGGYLRPYPGGEFDETRLKLQHLVQPVDQQIVRFEDPILRKRSRAIVGEEPWGDAVRAIHQCVIWRSSKHLLHHVRSPLKLRLVELAEKESALASSYGNLVSSSNSSSEIYEITLTPRTCLTTPSETIIREPKQTYSCGARQQAMACVSDASVSKVIGAHLIVLQGRQYIMRW